MELHVGIGLKFYKINLKCKESDKMLRNKGSNKLSMVEGDYGLTLPLIINGITIDKDDKINFYIKKDRNGEKIIDQIYENIVDNTIGLTFSEEESEKLQVGKYRYAIDWYKKDVFNGNLVKEKDFEVEDKL